METIFKEIIVVITSETAKVLISTLLASVTTYLVTKKLSKKVNIEELVQKVNDICDFIVSLTKERKTIEQNVLEYERIAKTIASKIPDTKIARTIESCIFKFKFIIFEISNEMNAWGHEPYTQEQVNLFINRLYPVYVECKEFVKNAIHENYVCGGASQLSTYESQISCFNEVVGKIDERFRHYVINTESMFFEIENDKSNRIHLKTFDFLRKSIAEIEHRKM